MWNPLSIESNMYILKRGLVAENLSIESNMWFLKARPYCRKPVLCNYRSNYQRSHGTRQRIWNNHFNHCNLFEIPCSSRVLKLNQNRKISCRTCQRRAAFDSETMVVWDKETFAHDWSLTIMCNCTGFVQ